MLDDQAKVHELIFNTVESMVVVLDSAGNVRMMNPIAEKITGYKACEAVGRLFWDIFIAPNERSAARQRLQNIINGTWPSAYERDWVSRDGTIRVIRWAVAVSRDERGHVRSVIGTGIDLTDSRRAEGALRDQTRLLQSVLDSVGDGVAVADASGNFLFFTPELERILGLPRPASGKTNWAQHFGFYLPDGVTPFPSEGLSMVRAIRGEVSNEVEMQIRRPDLPEPRWCSVNGRPLRDEAGRVCGGVIASRDITERKRSENEIRFRKGLLESQMEASIDGVLVVDEHGRILLANSRFSSMMGVAKDIVRSGIDKYALAAVHRQIEDPDEFLARVRWLYDHPDELSREEIRFKDGRTIDRFSAPVRTPAEEGKPSIHYGRVWIFRDITDLKLAEAAARRSAQVAQSNEAHFRQLAEHTRRLAREIDHRVGNNLAALLGLVAVTRRRATTVDALADAIENRLLAMAHVHRMLREGNWTRVSLAELISSVREMIAPKHGKLKFAGEGPEVWIEPRQVSPLTMVLVELLTNSTKYGVCSPAGGDLRVAWRVRSDALRPEPKQMVHLSWTERGGPAITRPVVPSLGTELVEGFITRELLGRCELRYPVEGVDHLIEFPLVAPESQNAPHAAPFADPAAV